MKRKLDDQVKMFADDTPSSQLTGDVDKMFHYCMNACTTLRSRNALYRGAYRVTGVLGAAFELISCTAKLHTLVTLNPFAHLQGATGEPDAHWSALLRNVLIDLHNYSLITLLMLDEDNFDGVVSVHTHYHPSETPASEDAHDIRYPQKGDVT